MQCENMALDMSLSEPSFSSGSTKRSENKNNKQTNTNINNVGFLRGHSFFENIRSHDRRRGHDGVP